MNQEFKQVLDYVSRRMDKRLAKRVDKKLKKRKSIDALIEYELMPYAAEAEAALNGWRQAWEAIPQSRQALERYSSQMDAACMNWVSQLLMQHFSGGDDVPIPSDILFKIGVSVREYRVFEAYETAKSMIASVGIAKSHEETLRAYVSGATVANQKNDLARHR